MKTTPLVLIVLDGWGVDEAHDYNAIEKAATPQWDEWWRTMPHGLLEASGEAVGLPVGQMGNSEVGHMHIGAGRVIWQDLSRINKAIVEGDWARDPTLNDLLRPHVSGQTLHVMGLLSDGGVHSHEAHLFALLELYQKIGVGRVALHLFLDGRDTSPQSALASFARLSSYLEKIPSVHIASICGRYYAMDRDARWDRVQKAYRLLTEGQGDKRFPDVRTAIEAYYQQGITDEFIPPTVIGIPTPMNSGDSVFCFNFRSDRVRQLISALVSENFHGFQRKKRVQFSRFVTMTQYEAGLPTKVLFPPPNLNHTLGEEFALHGLKQLRIAETEKYAHVTFFFNGGREEPYQDEARVLIPSPSVATYDLQPHMSAEHLTDELVKQIQSGTFDVIICNYANADMVGHTGVMSAAVEAVHYLDSCLKRVGEAVAFAGGVLLLTSDHGNAELMFDEATHQPHTAHTSQPVPFICVGKGWKYVGKQGSLIDVAPTILTVLGLPIPKEMTGRSLLKKLG